MKRYVACSSLPVSVEEAFQYHERPGALVRLIPPWESATVESSDGSLEVGSRVVVSTRIFGIPFRWRAEHTLYEPPNCFADKQVSGPFKSWNHVHRFEASGQYTLLRDSIEYELPLGLPGRVLGDGKALKTIEAMFAFRHRVTRDDLTLAADHPSEPLKIAVSGSTGLVGSQFCSLMTLLGHEIFPIVRSKSTDPKSIAAWDGEHEKLSEVDAVVHLAGKPIAGRWNDQFKQEVFESRVPKTRELCEKLASLSSKPKTLLCASATGVYGDRGDEELTEDSARGDNFLADVASQWEQACSPASDAGIRVVNARFGMILSPKDGALKKMLLPAKFCGGALGNGKQWWGWIALEDAIGAIYHVLQTPSLSGPVNFVAPDPCTNRQFAATLGSVVRRPALFPAPKFGLRIALGEMADSLLFASTRVTPTRLQQSRYRYRFTDLGDALSFYLGRPRLASAE